MKDKLNLSAEEVNTYPEMNEHIKDLLRMKNNDPVSCYALARILELERSVLYSHNPYPNLKTECYACKGNVLVSEAEVCEYCTSSLCGFCKCVCKDSQERPF
jgi:hypothetical protein